MEYKEQKESLTLTHREKQKVIGVIRTFEANKFNVEDQNIDVSNCKARHEYLTFIEDAGRTPNMKNGKHFKDFLKKRNNGFGSPTTE
jgi:hypothetical protein